MARKKLKLQYITDANQRKLSFKHRKKGLTKKLNEISILCGVDACAIIYDQCNPIPEVWPSNSEVNKVIERFGKLSLKDQTTRSVRQQEFIMQHIAKVETKTKKLIKANHEACMREAMFKYLGGEMDDFQMTDGDRVELCKYIDQYLKDLVLHRNAILQNPHFETGESSSMATNMATNLAPIPFMAQTAMREASRRPSQYFETGGSSSMAMVPNMMSQATVATNMAPIPLPPFMAPTTMGEASRPSQYFETGGSSSIAMVPNMMSQAIMATNMAPTTMGEASRPSPYFETGESSSMAMFPNMMSQATVATKMAPIPGPPFMAPTTIGEASRPSQYFESGESSSMAMFPNMMSQAIVSTNMAPIALPPFMAPTTMGEASRPSPYFETGESSSSMAMVPNMMSQAIVSTNMAPIPVPPFMTPTTMGEASSSKSPQLNNELQCIVSSNLPANSLATNLFPNNNQELYPSMNQPIIPSYQGSGSEHFGFLHVAPNNNNQEVYIPVMGQSMIPSYQGSEHFGFQEPNNNNQEVYIPVMGQDEFYNPNQNGIVDEMMGLAEQMGFPWMEDNHRYNNQN